MSRRMKWAVGIGTAALVVSLVFNWLSIRTIHGYTVNTQGNLMQGQGFIGQADQLLSQGDRAHASLFAYEGIGYLSASSGGMTQMGVHGVAGLARFMDVAMFSLLGYSNGQPPDTAATKQHYHKVIKVFINSFKPFGRVNFGSINNHQLQQAINRVYQSMTLQEKQEYVGWGP